MDRTQFQEITRVREEFVRKRACGVGMSIEDSMSGYAGVYGRLMLTSLIAAEVLQLRREGLEPDLSEYCGRFPGLSPYIRLAFGRPTIPHLFPSHWVETFI